MDVLIVSESSYNIAFSFLYFSIFITRYFIAYMSNPCHIEIILSEKEAPVKKAAEETAEEAQRRPKKVSKKKLARERQRVQQQP
jgi:hypothetical protein